MNNHKQMYLRQNVQVEPLFDRWYAWCHLIPPATAARNITERHIKIMDSYISAPQLHASAVRNPKMLGGPFVDHNGARVNEIRALRERTRQECGHLIGLSTAIADLDAALRENAHGYSLHSLYATVPDVLRGYVELVYDLNSQPSFRLIEPLLYKSKYYDKSLQSLMLQIIQTDDRPFILSTPRLDADKLLHLPLPFDHPGIDALFNLKSSPMDWLKVRDLLEVEDRQESLALTMMTAEPPISPPPYTGSGVRWRYFGHACILIESRGVSILLDPVISYTYQSTISRYTYLDLPTTIDYVIITHNHQDHVSFETMLQLRHRVKNVIVPRNGNGQLQDPSLKLLLDNCGFRNVIELAELEDISLDGVRITSLPFFGEHADLNISTKQGCLVRIGDNSLLFLADSCNIEPRVYEHIHRDVGDVDVLFIGMECDGAPLSWLYGPLLTQRLDRAKDESRRLSGSDCDQAMEIIECFACKEAYVYAMGQEPWLNYIMSIKYSAESKPIVESNRLIRTCLERGIVAERLFGEKEILY